MNEPTPPGEPFRLPAETGVGAVRLRIADLDRSVRWYGRVLGLSVLESGPGRALLGADGERRPLVELVERAGARPAPGRRRTGLFHFALLLPDRPALGAFVGHLEALGIQAGAADHAVSEAIYLQDPDNLGIEVYRDRPPADWQYAGGELRMTTDPLDLAELVQSDEGRPWTGAPGGTRMGHVHLHVGDLAAAGQFYGDALGFERKVWSYPGALFLAAGGYHHHLGTNVWAGRGASPPDHDEAQLLDWTLELPDEASRSAVLANLARHGHRPEAAGDREALRLRDPWGTAFRIEVAPPGGRELPPTR